MFVYSLMKINLAYVNFAAISSSSSSCSSSSPAKPNRRHSYGNHTGRGQGFTVPGDVAFHMGVLYIFYSNQVDKE